MKVLLQLIESWSGVANESQLQLARQHLSIHYSQSHGHHTSQTLHSRCKWAFIVWQQKPYNWRSCSTLILPDPRIIIVFIHKIKKKIRNPLTSFDQLETTRFYIIQSRLMMRQLPCAWEHPQHWMYTPQHISITSHTCNNTQCIRSVLTLKQLKPKQVMHVSFCRIWPHGPKAV